jgi:hypothetical protein
MAQHNYSYEKRQRDLAKKKKQEEKRQKKAASKQNPNAATESAPEPGQEGTS